MKRFSILCFLFFYICSLATPPNSYAIIPLGIIPASEIGATIAFAALAGSATSAAIKNNGAISANVSDQKTVYTPLVYYNKVMQAGSQVALGYTFQAILDVEDLYNSGVMRANAAFSSLLETIFPSAPAAGDNYDGKDIACNPSIPSCGTGNVAHMVLVSDNVKALQYGTSIEALNEYLNTPITSLQYGYGTNREYYINNGAIFIQNYNPRMVGGLGYADQRSYSVTYPTGTPTGGAALPDTLTDNQARALAAALPAAAASSPTMKSAINSAIASNPALIKNPPPALTANDIAAAVQAGTAAANQTLVDTLTGLVNANPDNPALQAELAKAIAQLQIMLSDVLTQKDDAQEITVADIAAAVQAGTQTIVGKLQNLIEANSGNMQLQSDLLHAINQLQATTASSNQTLVDTLQDLLATKPEDVQFQTDILHAIDKIQVTLDKLAEPEEPDPIINPPSTWYTGQCNSSNIASCINYQQIIDATESLKTTAPYQVPSFLLNCINMVKGEGCTYPPIITLDLFSKFTSSPFHLDLSPLESVVRVMRFFFSLLCFVVTYKSVMYLFK